ncbi:MAG: LPS export ABC transporter permease LptF [Candidatus Poribacteria bacterium]|nr:MAG: LPS export ABC transporter permease LptF [Candidatus Poribacteria bacterium]
MRILTRYLIREFLLYCALALVTTTTILLLRQIFLLTKWFVRKNVAIGYLFELIFYALPAVLSLTIPMAFLAGMLMVLGQFAFTGEITAIQASGIGVYQLIPRVFVVGVVFALLDFWMIAVGQPWGNTAYLNLLTDIRRQNPALVLEPETIMRELESRELIWFYEREDPKTRELYGVRMWQDYHDGHPRFVTATRGRLLVESGQGALHLYDGTAYQRDPDRPAGVLIQRFQEEIHYLPLDSEIERSETRFQTYRSMTLTELNREIRLLKDRLQTEESELLRQNVEKALRRAQLEWYKKWAIPFACLAFALAAVPLGVLTNRSGFMVGLVIGLPLVIVYYTLLRVGETLAVQGSLSAALGSWLPNIPVAALGVALSVRQWKR